MKQVRATLDDKKMSFENKYIDEDLSDLVSKNIHKNIYSPLRNEFLPLSKLGEQVRSDLGANENLNDIARRNMIIELDNLIKQVQLNLNERDLHRTLKKIFPNSHLNDLSYNEVAIKKQDGNKGRIDILILSKNSGYGLIIELKGTKAKLINMKKNIPSRPVEKATKQIDEYSKSEIDSKLDIRTQDGFKLIYLKKKVIISRRNSSDEYNVIKNFQANKDTIIQTWDSFVESLERILY